jgi:hypothetical protein
LVSSLTPEQSIGLFVLLLTLMLAAYTLRRARIARLEIAGARMLPEPDLLQWHEPARPVSFRFEAPPPVLSGSIPAEDRIAKTVAGVGYGAALGDASIAAWPLIHAQAMVDPTVVSALERWVNHGQVFTGHNLGAYLQAHHAAIFSVASHEGYINALSGFVGEQIAATDLAHAGHTVYLPESTNVPAWDMSVDGHLFQEKTGGTALTTAHDSVAAHPGIGIISTPDVAHHFPNSIGLNDLAPEHLHTATANTLSSLERISHGVAFHIPMITLALPPFAKFNSSYANIPRRRLPSRTRRWTLPVLGLGSSLERRSAS